MSLSPEQLRLTADAALITRESAETLTDALDATDQSLLSDLLDEWTAVRFKFSHLNGKIAGYVTDSDGKRLAVRNAIRRILDLPGIASEMAVNNGGGLNIESTLRWF